MRTICLKTKVKEESLDDIRNWFRTLKSRINETMETLRNEKVLVESVFLDKQGADYFLVYYMKAEDLDYVNKVFKASTLSIDSYHKDCWKKYCEGRVVLEELIDLENF